jgi:hypothetical protein
LLELLSFERSKKLVKINIKSGARLLAHPVEREKEQKWEFPIFDEPQKQL